MGDLTSEMLPKQFKTPDPKVMAVDEKTGAKKELKADRWDLMPWGALEYVALVYGKSAVDHGGKYPARNWEKGYNWGWSFRALIKHAVKPMVGEWYDPESGLPHLAHAAWHCRALMTYFDYKLGTDDRSGLGQDQTSPLVPYRLTVGRIPPEQPHYRRETGKPGLTPPYLAAQVTPGSER